MSKHIINQLGLAALAAALTLGAGVESARAAVVTPLNLQKPPLFLNSSVDPNIAVTFDDSGSMTSAFMPDNVDDCAPNPCLNGGSCTSLPVGYSCQCPAGFSGPSCEKVKCPCEADPKWNQTLAADIIATNIYTPTFKMVSGPTDFGDFMISASIGASSGTCRAIDLNMPNAFSNTPQTPTTVVQGQACLDQITAFHDKLCPGGVCVFPNH